MSTLLSEKLSNALTEGNSPKKRRGDDVGVEGNSPKKPRGGDVAVQLKQTKETRKRRESGEMITASQGSPLGSILISDGHKNKKERIGDIADNSTFEHEKPQPSLADILKRSRKVPDQGPVSNKKANPLEAMLLKKQQSGATSVIAVEEIVEEPQDNGKLTKEQEEVLQGIINKLANGDSTLSVQKVINDEIIKKLADSKEFVFQGLSASLLEETRRKWEVEKKPQYLIQKAFAILFPYMEGEYIPAQDFYKLRTGAKDASIIMQVADKKTMATELESAARSIHSGTPASSANITAYMEILRGAQAHIERESTPSTEIALEKERHSHLLAKLRLKNILYLDSTDPMQSMRELPALPIKTRERFSYELPQAVEKLNKYLEWSLESKITVKTKDTKSKIETTTYLQTLPLLQGIIIPVIRELICDNPLLIRTPKSSTELPIIMLRPEDTKDTAYIDSASFISKNIRGMDDSASYKQINTTIIKTLNKLWPQINSKKVTLGILFENIEEGFSRIFNDPENAQKSGQLKDIVLEKVYNKFIDAFKIQNEAKISNIRKNNEDTVKELEKLEKLCKPLIEVRPKRNETKEQAQEQYIKSLDAKKALSLKLIWQFYPDTKSKLEETIQNNNSDITTLSAIKYSDYEDIYAVNPLTGTRSITTLEKNSDEKVKATLGLDIESIIPASITNSDQRRAKLTSAIVFAVVDSIDEVRLQAIETKKATLPCVANERETTQLRERISKINEEIANVDKKVTTTREEVENLRKQLDTEVLHEGITTESREKANQLRSRLELSNSGAITERTSPQDAENITELQTFFTNIKTLSEQLSRSSGKTISLYGKSLYESEQGGISSATRDDIELLKRSYTDMLQHAILECEKVATPANLASSEAVEQAQAVELFWHSPKYQVERDELLSILQRSLSSSDLDIHIKTSVEGRDALIRSEQELKKTKEELEESYQQSDEMMDVLSLVLPFIVKYPALVGQNQAMLQVLAAYHQASPIIMPGVNKSAAKCLNINDEQLDGILVGLGVKEPKKQALAR